MPVNFEDHLRFKTNQSILNQLEHDEKMIFSCKVKKYNQYGISQARNFLLTSKKVCNFSKEEMKRTFEVNKLCGVTLSTGKGNKKFVIHVLGEYDYRYKSD